MESGDKAKRVGDGVDGEIGCRQERLLRHADQQEQKDGNSGSAACVSSTAGSEPTTTTQLPPAGNETTNGTAPVNGRAEAGDDTTSRKRKKTVDGGADELEKKRNQKKLSRQQSQKPKKVKTKHLPEESRRLRLKVGLCCASGDLPSAIDAYDRAVADGVRVLPDAFYNLMNLCARIDGDGPRRVHVGTPKASPPEAAGAAASTAPAASTGEGEAVEHRQKSHPTSERDASEQQHTDQDVKEDRVQETAAAADSQPIAEAPDQRHEPKGVEEEEAGRKEQQNQSPSTTVDWDFALRKRHAERIWRHMEEVDIPPVQSVYTAMIKLLVETDDMDAAERMLDEAEALTRGPSPKLRLYASLLHRYCLSNQMVKAIRVWRRLSKRGLVLSEREYAALLQCATNVGDAIVFERVLTDLAEDVFVPSKETCRAIVRWFQSPHAVIDEIDKEQDGKIPVNEGSNEDRTPDERGDNVDENAIESLLDSIKLPYSDEGSGRVGPVQVVRGDNVDRRSRDVSDEGVNVGTDTVTETNRNVLSSNVGWDISDGCPVDTSTGMLQSGCLKGSCLKPIAMSEQALKIMRDMNEEICKDNVAVCLMTGRTFSASNDIFQVKILRTDCFCMCTPKS